MIGRGLQPEEAQPGDLVFCHGTGFLAKAIRWAQRIRFQEGAKWNHVAILNAHSEDGNWTLYQAGGKGITDDGVLGLTDYLILPLPPGVDRKKVLEFAKAEVGKRYGFLTILSILVTMFTPKFINVMQSNTWICSAYGGECLRFGGWYHSWPDIYQVSPASLWEALPVITSQ